MITCITCENLDEFGKTFHSQFVLRHEEFVARQNYDVPVYEGMEFDQYDTPASRYLVYHTDDGKALAVSRLTPTSLSCMLKDLWPHMVDDQSLLQSPAIWEGSRYCMDKHVPPDLRQRIIGELACAYLEFGLEYGLEKIIGLMPTYIYRSVFERPGIVMEYLGPIHMIDRYKCRAVAIPVNPQQLAHVRQKTGITDRMLRFTLKTEGPSRNAQAS